MADAVVNFLVENLLQLIKENVKLIGDAKGELENLLKIAQQLKAFLDDAEKYGYTNSEQWKVLVMEIHKTVHRAEDAIDKFLVQAKLHQDKNRIERIFDWPSHLIKVRNLAAEIKGINDQVKELRKNNQALQATPVLDLPKKGEVTQGPSLENDAVVGFDDEANKVIKRLVEGSMESVDIIPVVGTPGLGKTTVARKIYNDSKLTYEFYSIVWVYVGQECKEKDIYLRILKFFKKNIEDHLNDDVDTLAKAIGGYIKKGGRCLIVLHDVWEDKVIDHVMKVFAENKKGHRIMMTTRDLRLAKFANPEPHELKFLKTEERALRGRSDKKDWERVDKNVVQHFGEHTEDSCLKFVKRSYDHLPQEVQMCFLYCGVFPRGFDIPCWKLIRLWIAEGLIKPQPEFTLEEIAEFYFTDLLNRNLVIIMQKRSDGQIKTCRLHDMLYQFCKKEASNKWLFQEPDQSKLDPDTCRRLCIQPSNLSDFLSTTPVAEHVRSFYCFSSKQKPIDLSPNEIKLIHKAFPLMRVLDVESLKFIFSKDFNQLFHLRYIAISGDFKALPPTFGKFWNLQTLILNTSTLEPTLEVKADNGTCYKSCEKDVLAKACNVKKLSIRGQMAVFLGAYKGGINNLEELHCLEHLKLLNDVLFINKTLHLPLAFSKLVRTVKKLTLTNTRFAWSEADKLGMLESLEVRIRILEASVINFPVLRQLVLISCDKLDDVPLELADIPSLQEMRLDNTSKAVKSTKNVRDSKTSKSMKLKLSIFPPENESKVAQ
ncbi:hypothetical protein MTR67_016149 [Solanum verrucosum]|uniref:NRC1 n=1 Tax=Solanum verrucosum TaxID=315347 RepID=A0AAF0TKQ3_SOLVR|nr:hypothetical protein MTR67_016149 [Solanum verrucosum]